jgi:CheY-like chemotaxis protein
MARILVVEPHAEVRELLERVVRRLGHEPVRPSGDDVLGEVDAAILEPAALGGHDVGRALRKAGIPTVFVSIFPLSTELRELEPVAHVLKPFALAELERAVLAATSTEPATTAS